MNYVRASGGRAAGHWPRHHLQIAFDVFEYGISKRRLLEGDTSDSDDWKVGHPILFPNILARGRLACSAFEIRVPDRRVAHLHYTYSYRTNHRAWRSASLQRHPVSETTPTRTKTASWSWTPCGGQDMMAWFTQGEISDRSTERLGSPTRASSCSATC